MDRPARGGSPEAAAGSVAQTTPPIVTARARTQAVRVQRSVAACRRTVRRAAHLATELEFAAVAGLAVVVEVSRATTGTSLHVLRALRVGDRGASGSREALFDHPSAQRSTTLLTNSEGALSLAKHLHGPFCRGLP